MSLRGVPVVILCGGNGIYIDGSGERRPKGLVEVAGEAMLIHLLRHFCRYEADRFILCCGRQMEDFRRLLLGHGTQEAHDVVLSSRGLSGNVELIDTGLTAPTGDRVRAAQASLGSAPRFCATYSDTLSHVNLAEVYRAHLAHGKTATCLGARLPTRFRIMGMRRGEAMVRGFARRPVTQHDFINGGFYIFQREVFGPRYLGDPGSRVLEDSVLEALARDGELVAYPYEGPWQYLDSERDLAPLHQLLAATTVTS